MNARILILLVVLVILGVVWFNTVSTDPSKVTEVSNDPEGAYGDQQLTEKELEEIEATRIRQRTLASRDLAGEEPADPPELSVRVEVDRSSGKNTLCAYITEAHGYYVETFTVWFFYTGGGKYSEPSASPLHFTDYANKYLKANDTLSHCIQVVPAELIAIDGDIGTSEDWDAQILSHGRARLENPDPLPPL